MDPTLHLLDENDLPVDSFPIVGGKLSIGRVGGKCDLRLDDHWVASEHALIWVRPDNEPVWFLEDRGSARGTFVNGYGVSGLHRLMHGDIIRIGRSRFFFAWDSLVGAA